MKSEYSLYISSLSICAVLNTMIIRSVYIYIYMCVHIIPDLDVVLLPTGEETD